MLYRNRLIRGLAMMALLAGILAGPAGRFLLTAHAGGVLTPAAPHIANEGLVDTLISLDYDIPDPSIAGGFVDVYYHVAAISGTPADGRVRVSGLNSYGCEGWLVRGQGGCRLLSSIAGPDSFVAAYSGNGILAPSTSVSEPHQVQRADTTTRITWDDPDPSVKGQPLLIRVSVAGIHTDVSRPTGSVVVKAGRASCSLTLKYGVGACPLIFTGTGDRKITAAYSGDANHNPSKSQAEFHTVIREATRTPTLPPPTWTSTPPTSRPTATRPGSLPPGPAGKSPTVPASPTASITPTVPPSPTPGCYAASARTRPLTSMDGAPLPDLAVSWMSIRFEHPGCYVPGDQLGLSLGISNLGTGPAGRFVVGMDGEERVVDGIDPQSRSTLFFHHFPGQDVCVMLDTTDAVSESDETNNQVGWKVPIPTLPIPCIAPSLTPSPMP